MIECVLLRVAGMEMDCYLKTLSQCFEVSPFFWKNHQKVIMV